MAIGSVSSSIYHAVLFGFYYIQKRTDILVLPTISTQFVGMLLHLVQVLEHLLSASDILEKLMLSLESLIKLSQLDILENFGQEFGKEIIIVCIRLFSVSVGGIAGRYLLVGIFWIGPYHRHEKSKHVLLPSPPLDHAVFPGSSKSRFPEFGIHLRV